MSGVSFTVTEIILMVVGLFLVAAFILLPILSSGKPLEEKRNFFDVCFFWSLNDYRTAQFCDNKNICNSVDPYCREALGLGPTDAFNLDDCRKQCPMYKED